MARKTPPKRHELLKALAAEGWAKDRNARHGELWRAPGNAGSILIGNNFGTGYMDPRGQLNEMARLRRGTRAEHSLWARLYPDQAADELLRGAESVVEFAKDMAGLDGAGNEAVVALGPAIAGLIEQETEALQREALALAPKPREDIEVKASHHPSLMSDTALERAALRVVAHAVHNHDGHIDATVPVKTGNTWVHSPVSVMAYTMGHSTRWIATGLEIASNKGWVTLDKLGNKRTNKVLHVTDAGRQAVIGFEPELPDNDNDEVAELLRSTEELTELLRLAEEEKKAAIAEREGARDSLAQALKRSSLLSGEVRELERRLAEAQEKIEALSQDRPAADRRVWAVSHYEQVYDLLVMADGMGDLSSRKALLSAIVVILGKE